MSGQLMKLPDHVAARASLMVQAGLIIGLIHRHRIELANEKAAQARIEEVFRGEGLAFEREARLSGADVPDFLMTETGLVVEVKVKGARKAAVYAQLRRYAGHERVRGLVLVTSMSMGLPEEIGGKPAFYASMGRAWI